MDDAGVLATGHSAPIVVPGCSQRVFLIVHHRLECIKRRKVQKWVVDAVFQKVLGQEVSHAHAICTAHHQQLSAILNLMCREHTLNCRPVYVVQTSDTSIVSTGHMNAQHKEIYEQAIS